MNNEIKGVFASTLGIKLEEVDALIEVSEDGESTNVEKLNAAMIARKKELEQENFGRAFRETNKKYEKHIIAKGFHNDEKLEGVELIDAYLSNSKEKNPELDALKVERDKLLAKINEGSDVDIQSSKEYIELSSKYDKVLKSIPLTVEKELDALRGKYDLNARRVSAKKMISDEIIGSDKYSLPDDIAKKRIHLNKLVLSEFDRYDFMGLEKGSLDEVIVLEPSASGEMVQKKDEFGHAVSFKSLIESVGEINLTPKVGTSRTVANGDQRDQTTVSVIKTAEDAMNVVRDNSLTPKQKEALLMKYEESKR